MKIYGKLDRKAMAMRYWITLAMVVVSLVLLLLIYRGLMG